MIRKTLLAVALVAALVPFVSRSAAAQDSAQRPVPAVGWNVLVPAQPPVMLGHNPPHVVSQPSYCSPCLFYGGDINPNSSTADGFANGNTVLVPLTSVFSPFTVAAGKKWAITGLASNNLSTDTGTIDPAQASWTVTQGPMIGVGFKHTIASGTTTATSTATGRSAFGLNEYTIKTTLGTTVHLGGGNYYISVVPQCTNANDSNCSTQFFESNTDGTNAFGTAEPQFHEYFNSAFFGFTYQPLCSVSTLGCNASSAAIIGTSN